jgi:heme exporter protein D
MGKTQPKPRTGATDEFGRVTSPHQPTSRWTERNAVLGYIYPAGGIFLSMFYFFIFFIWIMLLFRVFADLFRNKEMGGFTKFLWILFVIVVPFLGIFIYIIVHGKSMAHRDMEQAQAQQDSFKAYVQQTASTASTADQLAQLADLKDRGLITPEEFEIAKAKALA